MDIIDQLLGFFSAFHPKCVWTSPIWGGNGLQKKTWNLTNKICDFVRRGIRPHQPKGHFVGPQIQPAWLFLAVNSLFTPGQDNLFNAHTVPVQFNHSLPAFPSNTCHLLTESQDFFPSLSIVSFVLLLAEECEWQIFCGCLLRVGHCGGRVWRCSLLECVGSFIPFWLLCPGISLIPTRAACGELQNWDCDLYETPVPGNNCFAFSLQLPKITASTKCCRGALFALIISGIAFLCNREISHKSCLNM